MFSSGRFARVPATMFWDPGLWGCPCSSFHLPMCICPCMDCVVIINIIIIIKCHASRCQPSWTSTYPYSKRMPGSLLCSYWSTRLSGCQAIFPFVYTATFLSHLFCQLLLDVSVRLSHHMDKRTWALYVVSLFCPLLISFMTDLFACVLFSISSSLIVTLSM